MNKYILTLIICVCAVLKLSAQTEWVVPAEDQGKLSPVQFTEPMQQSGADIFSAQCQVCHGMPGQGNYNAMLVPSPGDPAAQKFQSNTDGAMFYKISEGRATMPSFKSALSKADIWNVISYVRSFNASYVQETAEKIETNIPEGTLLALALRYDEIKKAVEVNLTGSLNQVTNPVGGVAIKLEAKRYFGNLPLGDVKTTNKEGVAYFPWDGTLPGDSLGNVHLIAQIEQVEAYGAVKAEETLAIGKVNDKPALNKERAMWNTVDKAPLWILFGYTGAVLTAWFFIFYVLFMIRKIFIAGKEPIAEDQKII